MKMIKIQGVIISSIFVISLSGCSNSSPTWDQGDDSPWKAKRDASLAAAANEEFVEVSLEEPAQASRMEEAAFVEDTMPVPEIVSMPPLEQQSISLPEPVSTLDVMSAPASAYAVQVYAGSTLKSVNRYINDHDLKDLQIVKTDRKGSIIYVAVSVQSDRTLAKQKSMELEQSTGSKPWIRPIAGLQSIAVQ